MTREYLITCVIYWYPISLVITLISEIYSPIRSTTILRAMGVIIPPLMLVASGFILSDRFLRGVMMLFSVYTNYELNCKRYIPHLKNVHNPGDLHAQATILQAGGHTTACILRSSEHLSRKQRRGGLYHHTILTSLPLFCLISRLILFCFLILKMV